MPCDPRHRGSGPGSAAVNFAASKGDAVKEIVYAEGRCSGPGRSGMSSAVAVP